MGIEYDTEVVRLSKLFTTLEWRHMKFMTSEIIRNLTVFPTISSD